MPWSVDRRMAERHLHEAEDAILVGASLIERQREIIRAMEMRSQDATLAKGLLSTFLALQQEHLAHRDRLRLELGLDH